MRELWRGLAAAFALCAGLLMLLGLVSQGARLRALLAWAGPRLDLPALLGEAGLIFAEGTLPLAALLASGLAYGRARQEGALIALSATGHRPARLWGPALALGLLVAVATVAIAWEPAPRAAAALGARLERGLSAGLAAPPGGAARLGGAVIARDPGAWWAAWGPAADPWILRARALREAPATGWDLTLTLEDAQLWGPGLRISAGRLRVSLPAPRALGRLDQFGPPNALPSPALDPRDPHHRFVAHRRLALGLAALPWSLWGAALGAGLAPLAALPAGAALVVAAYWLLRTGELAARAGFGAPSFAAWAPALCLALALALWLPRAAARCAPR